MSTCVGQMLMGLNAHSHDIKALFRESKVVLRLIQKKARYLGLPELEALVPVHGAAGQSSGAGGKVVYYHVVSVDVDRFVADYQLFERAAD